MTWRDARHELDELLDGHLAQAAALLVVQQTMELDEGEHVDAPPLHKYAPRVAFQVFHEGRLVMHSAQAGVTPMAGIDSGFATVRLEDGTQWRVFAARGAQRDVLVYVGEQTASRSAILRAVLRSVLWPLVIALPLLALAGWWAVQRGLAPLHQLSQTLERRRPEALEPVALSDLPTGDGAAGARAQRPAGAHRRPAGVRAPLHGRRRARAAHADRGHPRPGPGGAGRGRGRGRAPACAAGHAGGLRPRHASGGTVADAGAPGSRTRRCRRCRWT